jgi:stress response protein YsnF
VVQQSRGEPADSVLPVTEERVEVGRRVVDTGRTLRLRKQVDEDLVEVREPLTSEFVEAVRVPVGRVLDAPVGIRHEGDVLIVPVIHERLVTRKELVLVEEVHITRRREVRESAQQVALRRESVLIERFDPETQQWLPADEGPSLS